MSNITGDGGDNLLSGGDGDDTVSGLGGRDTLFGGSGDDLLRGGGGRDFLQDVGGDDRLEGGGGDDALTIVRIGPLDGSDVIMDGGRGDDHLYFTGLGIGMDARLIGGDGDDDIQLFGSRGDLSISLGEGQDRVWLANAYALSNGLVKIGDFETGGGGDDLDLGSYLSAALDGWTPGDNPFGEGYLRLVDRAGGARLQIDFDGGGDDWRDLVRFAGTDADDFTAANFHGYDPDGA